MRILRSALAGLFAAVGLVLVVWSGWLYFRAAHGGDEDIAPTGFALIATVVLAMSAGFLYLAWRESRQLRK